MWRQASEKVRDRASEAKEYAEDHPWQMAAVGAAVGCLAGFWESAALLVPEISAFGELFGE